MVVPLLVALQTATGAPAAHAGGSGGSVTSLDGRITATKTASTYSLPLGGGPVTYTYTVQNNTWDPEYFVGASDDKCGTPSSGGLSYDWLRAKYYIPGGATVTFTCSQTVTVTTTNTATLTFNADCSWWAGCLGAQSQVAVKATVDVTVPTYSCDSIWYGSMTSGGTLGSVGTVLPSQLKVATLAPPGQTSSYANTSAIAMNPLDPNYLYYTARSGNTFLTNLYRVNVITGVQEQIASGISAFQTNRLAFDSDGTLWTFANNGQIYSWTQTGGISGGKTATFPNGSGGTNNPASLTSGDIAFDGLGNMWVLVSTGSGTGITPVTYLYTIPAAQLATATPQATLVGVMTSPGGNSFYNGLAFDTSGNLYASANDPTNSYLYVVNKDTGATTLSTAYPASTYGRSADLTSCALPKPQLVATKTVSPPGPVTVGATLTYTVSVKNIGSLSATGATFQDSIPVGSTYVAGSTKLNGAAAADSNGAMPYTTGRPINGSTTSFSGVIPAGDTATITFQVVVNSSALATGEVRNQGTVVYVGSNPIPTDDPTKPGGTDPTVNPIVTPAIEVKKSASPTTVNVSGPVTYTYQVTTGTGTEPIKNVTLSDDKCPNPTYSGGDTNNNKVLDPGETWTYTCTQTLSSTTTNTATVSGTGALTGTPVKNTAQATVTVTNPNLNLAKTAGTASGPDASGNYTATYTLTVTNSGTGQATYGPIADTPAFAPNLAVTGAEWTGQATGKATGAGPFSIGGGGTTLDPGQTHTYRVAVTFHYTNTTPPTACAGPGTGLYNSVALPAGQEKGPTTDNSACDTLLSNLVASKSVNPAAGTMVQPGQVLTYTLTFDNTTGTAPAPVSYTDWLGDILDASTFVTGSIITNTTTGVPLTVVNKSGATPQTLAITGTVIAGAQAVVTYQVKVNNAGNLGDALLENYLTPSTVITPPTSCPASGTTCTVNPVGSWTLGKTASPASGTYVNPGDPAASRVITYTVTATNSTANPVAGVVLTDDLSQVLNNAAFTAGSAKLAINGGTPISVPDPAGSTLASPAFVLPGSGAAVLTYSVTVNSTAWLVTLKNGATGNAVVSPERCATGSTAPLDSTCVSTTTTTGHLFLQKARPGSTSGSTVPLTGSSFEIHNDASGQMGSSVVGVSSAVSGSTGLVEVRNLVPGTYWLLETKAPNGYSLLATPVKFTLAANGGITLDSATAGPSVTVSGSTITVLDAAAVKLPAAGGPGSLWGVPLVGILLLMTSLAFIAFRRAGKIPTNPDS